MEFASLPCILIVDDDDRLRHLLASFFEKHGYRALLAKDGKETLSLAEQNGISLVLLDVNLPDINGFDLCRKLRALTPATPIIMLSARGEDSDRIYGLEIGADDYLPKPFNARELLARVKAVLRRSEISPAPHERIDQNRFDFGRYTFWGAKSQLDLDGKRVPLTGLEALILKVLIQQQGKVVTRNEIHRLIHNRELVADGRTIDVLIGRIRKQLDADDSGRQYIQTVRNKGYMFTGE